mgnify:CR=1 FL=1
MGDSEVGLVWLSREIFSFLQMILRAEFRWSFTSSSGWSWDNARLLIAILPRIAILHLDVDEALPRFEAVSHLLSPFSLQRETRNSLLSLQLSVRCAPGRLRAGCP